MLDWVLRNKLRDASDLKVGLEGRNYIVLVYAFTDCVKGKHCSTFRDRTLETMQVNIDLFKQDRFWGKRPQGKGQTKDENSIGLGICGKLFTHFRPNYPFYTFWKY